MNEELEKFHEDANEDLNPGNLKLFVDFEAGGTYAGKQMEIEDIKYRRKTAPANPNHEVDLAKHRKDRKRHKNSNSLF